MPRSHPPDPATVSALKRLDQLVQTAPDLADTIAFYRAAIPLLSEAQSTAEPFSLNPEIARQKLEQGQPLLVGEDLPLDVNAASDLFLKLCRVLERAPASANGRKTGRSFFSERTAGRSLGAEQTRRAVERGELDPVEVWQALMIGDWRRAELAASGLKLDAGLLRLLAENSLRPVFRAWAKSLRGLDFDHWLRGQCPVCGGIPLLSEIQGKEGARRLRCGMCGSGWYYPRLRCAFCDNKDHRQLGYVTVEGEEEKYSLQTCEACRGYSKVIVTFDPIPVDQLLVEDLATLHLDVIVEERGYIRPALTADALPQRRQDTKSHEAV